MCLCVGGLVSVFLCRWVGVFVCRRVGECICA